METRVAEILRKNQKYLTKTNWKIRSDSFSAITENASTP